MTQSLPNRSPADAMHLTVRIGKRLHAIPIAAIEEILPALPVEPVLSLPSFVRGVIYVRGHLIPVLSAAERLGIPVGEMGEEFRLVCLNINGKLMGLEVDEAIDLIQIDSQAALSVKEFSDKIPCLTAVIDHEGDIIRVLDPQQLLHPAESIELDEVVS